jgi:hypothetical protein
MNNKNNELINNQVKTITTQIDKLFDKADKLTQITTRAVDPKNTSLAKFHIFTEDKISKIANMMPEINRATRTLGRKNTQTTNKLMTLTMLSDVSGYRLLRQCLAEIEKSRSALKENRFKILKKRIKLEKLQADRNYLKSEEQDLKLLLEDPVINNNDIKRIKKESNDIKFKIMEYDIRIEEIASSISDAMLYIEGCLKDISSFQSSYEQIRKNHNIPENWDEKDAEESEIKHHIRLAFLHGYRDIMSGGRLGMGTLEYLQQFGIHPHTATKIITDYINYNFNKIENGELPDYNNLNEFLDTMENKFKDCYKQVLKRIGINNLIDEWFMYREDI